MLKLRKRGVPSPFAKGAPLSLSILALAVSLLAMVFTGLQWWEAHQQKRLQTKPLVAFYIESDANEPKKGLAIDNLGPGPAVIKSIRYFVDRQLLDEQEVLQHVKLNPDFDHGVVLDEGDVLGVGQRVWLIDYRTKNDKEIGRLADLFGSRLVVEVSYCSIGDECWRKCSPNGRC
jgi:hypothetical protein